MRNNRDGGKRTNWPLIKHHDGFSVEENGAAILAENAISVASDRVMEAIGPASAEDPLRRCTSRIGELTALISRDHLSGGSAFSIAAICSGGGLEAVRVSPFAR